MEQTLTREYWGRFLIEMLQNARDAWLADGRGGSDGVLRIRLTGDPALVVCNEGTPLTSSIVLDSIAKFGESPKKPGEGIGHKGIGFKAVLELTRSPRIYSRTDASGSFDLSVYFDPDEARRMLMAHSPRWNELVAQLASASGDPDGGDRIPILRFPLWDDDPPTWLDDVAILDGRAFNTVIALPYDTRFDGALGLTRDDFCERVRTAFRELSDEVVLLLGVFARIVIEDEAQRPPLEISRTERALETQVDGATLHEVEIGRDGSHPSRWWLFRRSLPEASGIAGDLAVAIHLEDGEDGRQRPVTPQDGLAASGAAECFHLFFPTRIRTHLPFLLHAYFEVDAGRKGFAEDRAGENQGRLDGLRRLVVDAMTHMSKQVDAVDLEPLPALFAATAGTPEDGLAHKFRDDVLRDLDRTPWVLTRLGSIVSPRDLLVDEQADAHRVLPHAFPDQYVARRIGRSYPLIEKAPALEFLAHRAAIAHGAPTAGLGGAMLVELLHPGPGDVIWDADPDVGFQKILELLDIVKRRDSVAAALETVRSDTSAVFIPVVDGVDERRLRAPGHDTVVLDDEDDPVPVGAILARVTASRETSLVPPRSLGLDFLRDGLLDAEQLAGVGAKLGIRPYLTEVIIDALARAGAKVDEREALPFVWRLLLRERGKYSIINVLRTSAKFEPGSWYWSKADGNTTDGRENRRRARALANLPLPTRHSESEWRPAGELAFGRDWADWLDAHAASLGVASVARADAYRDLERAADPSCMIASPSILAGLLPLSADDIAWAGTEAAPDLPDDDGTRHLLLIHAFLLRLGVWEIPPVKGFVNYRHPRRVEGPPWATEDGWQRLRAAHAAAGGPFGQFGHANVYLSEDFSLAWSLTSDPALIRSLARGADFYKAYRKAELFCPQCSGEGSRWHQRRYSSDGDPRFLSYLAWQLAEEPWVPASTWGSPSVVSRARDTWLPDERPDDARMQQSWMRFLPIASQDVAPALASLAGVRRLAEADASRIEGLLRTLQGRFEAGEVDPERRAGSLASQTFIGLHWRLYEQLANLDAAIAREVLDRVGVLAVHGRALVYRPRSEVRHDDGADSSFRRYFAGRVAFSILPRDLGPVADALEIERFRVGVERVQGGKETDVTVDVRPFIHERAAELLALQVFHPLGTKALQLDGREFPVRAERLRTLNVVRVNDLVLRLSVPTLHLDKEIGADFNEDLYLDDRSSPPTLYLDLSGSRWADRLRALAGPYLAMLLENNAYGATFQLLLQAETEVEVESFLEERSVSPEDVELVRSQIDVVAGVVRNEERRWWRAVLPLLGSTSPDELDGDAYRRTLKERVEARAMGSPVPGSHSVCFEPAGATRSGTTDRRTGHSPVSRSTKSRCCSSTRCSSRTEIRV